VQLEGMKTLSLRVVREWLKNTCAAR